MTDDHWNATKYVDAAADLRRLTIPAECHTAVVANLRGLYETSRLLEGWRDAVGATDIKANKQ